MLATITFGILSKGSLLILLVNNDWIKGMFEPSRKKQFYNNVPTITFFLFSSFFLCRPLFHDLMSSCRGDWDYFFSLYEVASISLLEYHQFPLWNPYCGGGISLIGNPQAGFLSPILPFTLLFGVIPGLKISVWLHTFLGMIGMWLLGRHMGIRGSAEIAPPMIFMFSSAWSLHLAEGHIVWLPAAILPLFFLAYLKGLDSRKWLFVSAGFGSIMLYEGGTYVFAFSLIFLFVYAGIYSLEKRNWHPITVAIATTVLSAMFAAPKLLPSLELLSSNPRITEVGSGIPWDALLLFFIDRSQTLTRAFMGAGWWEYGSYLGILGVALYLFSFKYFIKYRAIALSSLCILLISLGNFSIFSPWNLLHTLPLFNFLKVPTRCLIIFSFSAALLVGLSLTHFGKCHDRRKAILVILLVLVVGIDLFSVSYNIISEATQAGNIYTNKYLALHPELNKNPPKLYRVSPTASTRIGNSISSVHQPFSQISIPDSQRNIHGAWSNQYLPLLQNKGVVDAYETIPFQRHALSITDPNYNGEYYFLGNGTAALQHWSPNKSIFKIKAQENGKLVINQNFAAGWHVTRGMINTHKGLLSIDLNSGEYELSVYYLPYSLLVGAGIFLTTMTFIPLFVLKK